MKPANGKVIIAGRSGSHTTKVYHTDDSCPNAQQSQRDALRLVDPATLTDDYRECSLCAEGYDCCNNDEQSHAHYRSLRDAGKGDGKA